MVTQSVHILKMKLIVSRRVIRSQNHTVYI